MNIMVENTAAQVERDIPSSGVLKGGVTWSPASRGSQQGREESRSTASKSTLIFVEDLLYPKDWTMQSKSWWYG